MIAQATPPSHYQDQVFYPLDKGKRLVNTKTPNRNLRGNQPPPLIHELPPSSLTAAPGASFVNINKREREIELSAVVQLKDACLLVKKSKVHLSQTLFIVYT